MDMNPKRAGFSMVELIMVMLLMLVVEQAHAHVHRIVSIKDTSFGPLR